MSIYTDNKLLYKVKSTETYVYTDRLLVIISKFGEFRVIDGNITKKTITYMYNISTNIYYDFVGKSMNADRYSGLVYEEGIPFGYKLDDGPMLPHINVLESSQDCEEAVINKKLPFEMALDIPQINNEEELWKLGEVVSTKDLKKLL